MLELSPGAYLSRMEQDIATGVAALTVNKYVLSGLVSTVLTCLVLNAFIQARTIL